MPIDGMTMFYAAPSVPTDAETSATTRRFVRFCDGDDKYDVKYDVMVKHAMCSDKLSDKGKSELVDEYVRIIESYKKQLFEMKQEIGQLRDYVRELEDKLEDRVDG